MKMIPLKHLRLWIAKISILVSLLFISDLSAATVYQVSAWSWGDPTSLDVATDRGALDELNVVWFFSQKNGLITRVGENKFLVTEAQSRGVKVFASISNMNLQTFEFDPRIASSILRTSQSRNSHADRIYKICVTEGYDGIDLDWESLYPNDRDRFSSFVATLSQKLHRVGKKLSIAIHPKTSEPGDWDGPKAQDWKKLGVYVDEFKIMTYDYSGPWSVPGPIAPPDWVDQVLSYAESLVPVSKIMMGVPFYGYDFYSNTATPLTWEEVQSLDMGVHSSISSDLSGEATFTYSDQVDIDHIVFFQDRLSISIKLHILLDKHPLIRGICIWRMGQEDTKFWDEINLNLRM